VQRAAGVDVLASLAEHELERQHGEREVQPTAGDEPYETRGASPLLGAVIVGGSPSRAECGHTRRVPAGAEVYAPRDARGAIPAGVTDGRGGSVTGPPGV
jgi:hypothetical protein